MRQIQLKLKKVGIDNGNDKNNNNSNNNNNSRYASKIIKGEKVEKQENFGDDSKS